MTPNKCNKAPNRVYKYICKHSFCWLHLFRLYFIHLQHRLVTLVYTRIQVKKVKYVTSVNKQEYERSNKSDYGA